MNKTLLALLLIAVTTPALAEDAVPSQPAPPKNCRNPDGMARFTLECLKLTNDGLQACYRVSAQIYCEADSAPPSPANGQPATTTPNKP